MADTYYETNELQVKLTLQQGTATTTRTFTIPEPDITGSSFRNGMDNLKTALTTGGLSGLVQPANWRDAGDADPYDTTNVEFTQVITQKTQFDTNNA